MTTTRINHIGHDHPSTTTARTACRKSMKGFSDAIARIDAHAATGLAAGRMVQYRKVGTARLVAPLEARYADRGWWKVEWVKAPRKYMDRNNTPETNYIWVELTALI